MRYSIDNDNKYDFFYRSVKELAINLNLSTHSDFEGISESLIFEFEKTYNIHLPTSIRCFLKYFGKKINIRDTDIGLSLTLKNLEEATSVSINKKVTEYLNENPILPDYIDDSLITNINNLICTQNIIYLNWDETRSALSFIDCSRENPKIYYLMEYKYFINELSMSFTNHIRFYIFLALKTLFKNNLSIDEYSNLKQEKWQRTYQKIFQNRLIGNYELHKARIEFNVIINELEEINDNLFSIDEFENKFIDFLNEKGYEL